MFREGYPNIRLILLIIGFITISYCVISADEFAFGDNNFIDPLLPGNGISTQLNIHAADDVQFFPADKYLKGKNPGELLIDTSHTWPFGSIPTTTHFRTLILLAQSLGFNVTIASDFTNLSTYDVVIETVPQTTFSPSDITDIVNYLDSGKILIFLGERYSSWDNTPINDVLSSIGAGISIIQPTIVSEPVSYYQVDYWPIIFDMQDHCLNQEVSEVVFGASARLEVVNPDSALFWSTDQSDDGLGAMGPFVLAAIPDPTVHPSWRLYVAGDTNHLAESSDGDWLTLYDNNQHATNILLWCEPCETNQDCDDGLWCNGIETCDTDTSLCLTSGEPCADDQLWCNGEETCDEDLDQCNILNVPDCSDDGLWCNGDETCDESLDKCSHSGNPCPDDGLWCNGQETCDDVADQCAWVNIPECEDDGMWCNGEEGCDEDTDQCVHSGDPCSDDELWCNGFESCDEISDQCIHSGGACVDDVLWCNGEITCDETNDICLSSGGPCTEDQTCNEELDRCEDPSENEDDDSVDPVDDDAPDGQEGDTESWPEGKVTGGCCGC